MKNLPRMHHTVELLGESLPRCTSRNLQNLCTSCCKRRLARGFPPRLRADSIWLVGTTLFAREASRHLSITFRLRYDADSIQDHDDLVEEPWRYDTAAQNASMFRLVQFTPLFLRFW